MDPRTPFYSQIKLKNTSDCNICNLVLGKFPWVDPWTPLPLETERSEVPPRCSARISRTNAQVLDFSMLASMLVILYAAYFQEQGLVLSAVAHIPHHTAATPTLSGEVHQQIPSILGLGGTHAYCDIWLLLTLVVRSVDGHELHLMRPSHGTVDAGGSPGCQSIFHCRGSPMLSLLHISHRALKPNVYAAPSPAHGSVVRWVFP